MTVNDFNCKINLPALALHLGHKGLEFVKIPKFGWFAHNKDKSVIMNVFQIGSWTAGQAYQYLTKDHPEFQESRVLFSEISQNKLQNDAQRLLGLRAAYSMCLDEMETGKIKTHHGKSRVKNILDELGLPMMSKNMIGVVTSKVLRDPRLPVILDEKHSDRLILAGFATPQHPCSFESVNLYDLAERKEIHTNGEKGWYGVLDNRIVTNIHEFGMYVGNTWDKKCDYWQQKIVDLSPNLNEEQCIRIWVEAKNARFNKNPIDIIQDNQKLATIKNHTRDLNLVQIRELEKMTNMNLFDCWKQQKQEEISIGGIKFIQRDFRYYFSLADGAEVEFTNFTLKLTKVQRDGLKYIYHGVINYNGSETVCEIPEASFRSSYTLMNYLRVFFLEAGIGIPVITPTYKQYLLYVIQKFSENATVNNTIPVS